MTRADRNNNPTAFTTDLARQAGLVLGVDYSTGDEFDSFHTAKLIGDPLEVSIRLIDAVGYYTKNGATRWTYIALPSFIWHLLTRPEKIAVIGFHYQHEGGSALEHLFAS